MHRISLTVNGQEHQLEVKPDSLLVSVLRDNLGLTGTHVGCDTSQCGCCNVLMDGVSIKSCAILALQADGCHISTVEGLSQHADLHPIQEAFSKCHGLQCGFCTPGMIMTTACLLSANPKPSDEDIVHALEGNLCRCTGYVNIIESVREASRLIAAHQA